MENQSVIEVSSIDTVLTPLFYLCDCEVNHIHPASEPFCPHCGAQRDDCPDADVELVLTFLPDQAQAIVDELKADLQKCRAYLESLLDHHPDPDGRFPVEHGIIAIVGPDVVVEVLAELVSEEQIDLTDFNIEDAICYAANNFWNESVKDHVKVLLQTAIENGL